MSRLGIDRGCRISRHGFQERPSCPEPTLLSFDAQGLLRDVLEVVKAHGTNGKTRYSIKPLEEKLSFDKGFYVFIRAIQMLVHRNKGVVLVSQTSPKHAASLHLPLRLPFRLHKVRLCCAVQS